MTKKNEKKIPAAKKRKRKRRSLRLAMPAWEIGRVESGFGVKIGGLGAIVEELPNELVKAAARQDIDLEVVILTPCFAHYDRTQLTDTGFRARAYLDGSPIDYQVFEHVFDDGQKAVYFWDDWQFNWTGPQSVYPEDPLMGFRTYAAASQAMAHYVREAAAPRNQLKARKFDVVHSHDYHVALIPFYLPDELLASTSCHFTIHNATYQGMCPPGPDPYERLFRIHLDGFRLFHEYFDAFSYLNPMKAAMIRTHQLGGKITTVSGDLRATWGYAAELRENADSLWNRARAHKWWGAVGEIFLPNRHLDVFEQLPIAGITNGLAEKNRPEKMPELKASALRRMQKKKTRPIFSNRAVQRAMLARDHQFDSESLDVKAELKRLLHLEAFGYEATDDPILMTTVGRMVSQKNFGLILGVAERVFAHDPGVKFVIMASAGDAEGDAVQAGFLALEHRYPERFHFRSEFNQPLSRLILAGGDFCLVPSRFEPCGLVDYEASLLGNVVIGRRTGGLAKVGHCAYLYEWLDMSDRGGEADAFFDRIREAVDVYRRDRARHQYLIKTAMAVDASWDRSADQYVHMYRYGQQMKRWQAQRRHWTEQFGKSLGDERRLFNDFFIPASGPYEDAFNRQLRAALDAMAEED